MKKWSKIAQMALILGGSPYAHPPPLEGDVEDERHVRLLFTHFPQPYYLPMNTSDAITYSSV